MVAVKYEPADRACPLCAKPRIEHKNRNLAYHEKGHHRGTVLVHTATGTSHSDPVPLLIGSKSQQIDLIRIRIQVLKIICSVGGNEKYKLIWF